MYSGTISQSSSIDLSTEIYYIIEQDLSICEKIWNLLVHHQVLTDLWEYRLQFHLAYSKKPYFICAYKSSLKIGVLNQNSNLNNHDKEIIQENGEIIAVLPLEWLELDGGHYSFFGGGCWNEGLHTFSKEGCSQVIINHLYDLAPKPCYLHSIPECYGKLIPGAIPEMETYFLKGADFQWNFDNVLLRMSKETRKSVKRGFRDIVDLKPEIHINNFDDIPSMIALNKQRFGEESTFNKPHFEETILAITNSPKLRPYLRVISIRFEGVLKSCALCVYFNNNYIYLASGNDDTIQNLPKYLIHLIISDAFQLHVNFIYMLCFDCGWKERWKIDKTMLYVVDKQ